MRDHPRAEYVVDVEIAFEVSRRSGRTVNISVGGAFVSTDPPPPVGNRVILTIRLPGVRDLCGIPSVVRWSKIDEGVGLQFESLRPIEVWSINNIMRSAKPAS